MKYSYRRVCATLLVMAMITSLQGFQVGQAAKRPRFNKAKVSIFQGNSYTLRLKNVTKSQIRSKSFTSSRKQIATVTATGKITAKNQGKTVVRCKLRLKNGKKYTLRCTVTVKKRQSISPVVTQKPETTLTPSPAGSTKPQGSVTSSPVTATVAPGEGNAASSMQGSSESSSPSSEVSAVPGSFVTPAGTQDSSQTMISAAPGNVPQDPAGSDTVTTETTSNPTVSSLPEEPGTVQTVQPGQDLDPITTVQAATTVPQESQTVSPETTATVSPVTTPTIPSEGVTALPQGTDSLAGEITASPDTAPLVTDTPVDGESGEATVKTAEELIQKMGLGINLGNTLESCSDYPWFDTSTVTGYETAWGAPETTQAMIQGMKKAGFHTLRIPVAWSNMMSTDGTYTINQKYFERVKTIVDWALQEDMYVIINIHYDSGWWGWFGSPDEELREQAQTKYETMWTQIAKEFKDYSHRLVFESANEELGTSPYYASGFNEPLDSTGKVYNEGKSSEKITGTLTQDECYEKANQLNQTFVNIVRQSGGNNASRFLLIAGYTTDIDLTCDNRFKMPEDTIDSHLAISIHYYTPSDFCLSEDATNTSWYAASWGTESDKEVMKSQLEKMKTNFVDKGYPVIIGEYGVVATKEYDSNYNVTSVTRKEGKDEFIQTLCEYALENGMCPVLWDITEQVNSVYDRSSCSMAYQEEADLYLKLAGIETLETEDENGEEEDGDETGGQIQSLSCRGTVTVSNYYLQSWEQDTNGENSLSVTKNGGCLVISGVDWTKYTNPALVVKLEDTQSYSATDWDNNDVTSTYYALTVNPDKTNESWWGMSYDTAQIKGEWTNVTTQEVQISLLPDLDLSSDTSVCFIFQQNAFTGDVSFTLTDEK